MKEARIGRDQPLIAHHQPPKVPQPGEGALHYPPPLVPPQLAPILVRSAFVTLAGRDERLRPSLLQPLPQGIAVVGPIGDQPVRTLAGPTRPPCPAHGDRVERLLQESDLRRGCRVQVCSQRSTRAIDQNHPLRALAPLGLAHLRPPFFAGAKLPSAKHSSQRIFSRSLSWAKNARHSLRSTPLSSHSRRRRQQVLGLPYRRGSSLQGAPVHRIQRMPSKHLRASARGRPPLGRGRGGGKWTRIFSHCSSVKCLQAMPPAYYRPEEVLKWLLVLKEGCLGLESKNPSCLPKALWTSWGIPR